jgi:hypothetical protein
MTDTTSIMDLPTDPVGGGSIGGSNINLNINEKTLDNNISLDQNTINQIVNGLQQASSNGATVLPSRDIPRNTVSLTQDPYIKPNYIPPTNNKYIEEDIDKEEIENDYNNIVNNENNLDILYDEIQTPLLLIILYFIFQLPIFKTTIFKYFPFFCSKDGNMNLYGLIFMSILYGSSYYILFQFIMRFSKF